MSSSLATVWQFLDQVSTPQPPFCELVFTSHDLRGPVLSSLTPTRSTRVGGQPKGFPRRVFIGSVVKVGGRVVFTRPKCLRDDDWRLARQPEFDPARRQWPANENGTRQSRRRETEAKHSPTTWPGLEQLSVSAAQPAALRVGFEASVLLFLPRSSEGRLVLRGRHEVTDWRGQHGRQIPRPAQNNLVQHELSKCSVFSTLPLPLRTPSMRQVAPFAGWQMVVVALPRAHANTRITNS
ncbi:hypothetical protein BT67DRAFT_116692 [Trichocladium antarcticum]|uniref:Uncharacterized protein n=1 Tax=Trichocladium antarcticum TaxID=1450529 RepID=A0AAN6UR31_9PEZI|nr:hypothetical protein BT67DRAFT_116692 [Trichocladium antarcticum]